MKFETRAIHVGQGADEATVVTPESGRLSPAGDPAPLAAALVELAGDRELRRRLGAAGREHVSARFGAQRLLGDIDALYRELLATRPRR